MRISKAMERAIDKWLPYFIALLVVWCGARTYSRGDDFVAYYNSAVGFFDGVNPYDLSVYGNMVVKYPPWIFPFFFPFGIFNVGFAKFLFILLQGAALFLIPRVLKRDFGVRSSLIILGFLLFLPILLLQAMVGQLSLFLMLGGLYLAQEKTRNSPGKIAGLIVLFSLKVLTLYPFIAMLVGWIPGVSPRLQEKPETIQKQKRGVGYALGLFFLLTLPFIFFLETPVGEFLKSWVSAMFSGTTPIHSVTIGFTTREAQGLPSLILRLTGWAEDDKSKVILSILLSIIGVLSFSVWGLRKLSKEHQVLWMLALTPLILPLTWFHLYLPVFPMVMLLMERLVRLKKPVAFFCVVLLCLLLTAVTEKTMGAFGLRLEFLGVKSIATLGLALLFHHYFQYEMD